MLVEEHVLGAAEPDALGAELQCHASVARRVRIGAHAKLAQLVGPPHQGRELARERGLGHRHAADQHLTGRAVDGDDVARFERMAADGQAPGSGIDAQRTGPGDARLAHAARDHRGVRGHAAAGGQNSFGRVHAVDVFGRSLDPHQDHAPVLRLERLGGVGRKHDLARGRARRGRQAGRDHFAFGGGIDGRVQELVEGGRVDARHRLLARDQALAGQLDRDAQRRLGGALARARLQHPELALLDGEFEVLHVAVVFFEHGVDAREFLEGVRQRALHRGLAGASLLARGFGDLLRRADAGDHVLALGVDQEFTVEALLAGGRIARERNAGRGILPHVAEYHGLHVDRSTPALRDAMQAAIGNGALVHPRAEHGADRAP